MIGAGAIGFISVTLVYSMFGSTIPAADAYAYLAAGERLNAGHSVYALVPGDRAVVLYSGVPLVSPPLIAVLWRPLSALPDGLGRWVWWSAQTLTLGVIVGHLLRQGRPAVSLAVYALAMPIGFEMAVGNMNGFLAAGAILVWVNRDRWWVGLLIGVMASAKLVPLLLLAWLIGQRHWSATVAFGVAVVVCAALVDVGAGPTTIPAYLMIASHIRPSPQSLAAVSGITQASLLALGAFGLLAVVLRGRPAIAFAVACAGMVIGSPAVNLNWLVMLLPAVVAVASRATAGQTADPPMSGERRQVTELTTSHVART